VIPCLNLSTLSNSGSLRIYQLPISLDDLLPATTSYQNALIRNPAPLSILNLPPFNPSFPDHNLKSHSKMQVSTLPIPQSRFQYRATSPSSRYINLSHSENQAAPFKNSDAKRIISISLVFILQDDTAEHLTRWVESFVFLAHVDTLLRVVTVNSHLMWDEWGPQTTRLIGGTGNNYWKVPTSGTRVMTTIWRPIADFPIQEYYSYHIMVLDFNPGTLSEVAERSKPYFKNNENMPIADTQSFQHYKANLADDSITQSASSTPIVPPSIEISSPLLPNLPNITCIVDQPSITVAPNVFQEPVTTTLPYYQVIMSSPICGSSIWGAPLDLHLTNDALIYGKVRILS